MTAALPNSAAQAAAAARLPRSAVMAAMASALQESQSLLEVTETSLLAWLKASPPASATEGVASAGTISAGPATGGLVHAPARLGLQNIDRLSQRLSDLHRLALALSSDEGENSLSYDSEKLLSLIRLEEIRAFFPAPALSPAVEKRSAPPFDDPLF